MLTFCFFDKKFDFYVIKVVCRLYEGEIAP